MCQPREFPQEGVLELQLTVDLSAIRRNVAAVRASTGREVLLMVKADGYGHGMERVALALEDDVAAFGVATLEEGLRLRRSGVGKCILVCICSADEVLPAAESGLTVAVADESTLEEVERLSKFGIAPDFHVKIDTGMHRLGFPCERARSLAERMATNGLCPSGVYSHLRSPNEKQVKAFAQAAAEFKEVFPDVVSHLASSSSLEMQDALFGMVRIGHAAYKGAMKVTSRVVAVRQVRRGECVGYGEMRVSKDCNLAVVFGGYFDGVQRENPSCVVIRGRKCPCVGSVCMDMFAVDTGDFVAECGETVVLVGGELSAEEVATERNTVDYTVMTGWHGRVQRIFEDDQSRGKRKS